MSIQRRNYRTEQDAPGDGPYELHIEHAGGWENPKNASSWRREQGDLRVTFEDIGGSITYEEGVVTEAIPSSQ